MLQQTLIALTVPVNDRLETPSSYIDAFARYSIRGQSIRNEVALKSIQGISVYIPHNNCKITKVIT